MKNLRFDCRHFKNDRPCLPHKQKGVTCPCCTEYRPVQKRVLLIKLGARGDVLRTTSLLEPLRRQYPECELIWVVEPVCAPLLENISEIDQVWIKGRGGLARLSVEHFDVVMNLDLDSEACALASLAKSEKKHGFGLGKTGRIYPFENRGWDILMMSVRDDVKKQNRKTYQKLMLELIDLEYPPGEILVNLTQEEKNFALRFAEQNGVSEGKPVFGINVGAGGRWEKKSWKFHHTLSLIDSLDRQFDGSIILLGGRDEEERIRLLQERTDVRVLSSGTENSLREFMAIVGLCDVVVTGDTMALHIALGLGKNAVALFGPTSEAEIETYGRAAKLIPDIACLCCYRETCNITPDCMELLTPERVLDSIESLLRK